MIKFIFLIFILYVLIYNTIQTKVTIEPLNLPDICPSYYNCNNEKIKKEKRMKPLKGYTNILDLILSPENPKTPLGININYL
jgi:hypothetical protein